MGRKGNTRRKAGTFQKLERRFIMSYDEFIEFLTDRFGYTSEELKKTNSFGELGLDSLSLYNLVTDLEEKFNISIEIEDLTEVDSVEKMYHYISEKVSK